MEQTQRGYSGQQKTGKAGKEQRDQLFTFDSGDTHHPPWFVNGLAWIGIITGGIANFLQVVTSDIAIQHMITTNEVYKHLGPSGQNAVQIIIQIMGFGIAFVFQLGLMFFIFRVKQEYKNTRVQHHIKGMEAIKYTAVQMVDQQKILLVWTGLAFMVDTLGDFTFVTLLVDDWFVIFIYAAALYAASTILLSKALETHWAAAVAYANWKSFKLYQKIQELKIANQAS